MAGIVLVLSNDNNQADEHLTASSIQDIPLIPKSEHAISGLKRSSQVIL